MRNERITTVHVGRAWRLLFRDLGLDEVAILRRAGLPPTLLDSEGTHISLDDYYALHEAIEAESDDPTMALKAGKVVSIEMFDPAIFSALCSPDMNTAAARLGQFKRLVGPFSLDVDIGADQTHIRFRCKYRPDVPMTRGLSEIVFLVAFARRATRHEIVPRRVTVQHLPTDRQPYVEYLGCPLDQDDACTVVFSALDANRPFLTHNAPMWEAFEPGLRRRMAEADEARSTSDRVEAALFELLPSGRAQVTDVAKELGMGTRTLQRRLAAEDTSWLAVLNRTRERLARHYLRNTTMSPAEVGFLLGFEDPNSLFRAFHRWTGTTPELWRADAHAMG
ncbi:MAG: AraC family transcriptional regulator ligand-binding domain-containing protein [Myxococcota bacterium]